MQTHGQVLRFEEKRHFQRLKIFLLLYVSNTFLGTKIVISRWTKNAKLHIKIRQIASKMPNKLKQAVGYICELPV